jgi:hypothetical protein
MEKLVSFWLCEILSDSIWLVLAYFARASLTANHHALQKKKQQQKELNLSASPT